MTLHDWAMRWSLPVEAVRELHTLLGTYSPPLDPVDPAAGKSEAWAQSAVRLEGAKKDVLLFRNNVGALKDAAGRLVRYGLANDSAGLNQRVKSGDLIGIRRVLITPAHVGHTLGQFVSREIKAPGWQYTGTEREEAQRNWVYLIQSHGGDAAFATGPGTL